MMIDPETGGIHTAHTNLPVPLIYVGSKAVEFKEGGKLSDLAPTMLSLALARQPMTLRTSFYLILSSQESNYVYWPLINWLG